MIYPLANNPIFDEPLEIGVLKYFGTGSKCLLLVFSPFPKIFPFLSKADTIVYNYILSRKCCLRNNAMNLGKPLVPVLCKELVHDLLKWSNGLVADDSLKHYEKRK